MKLSRRWFLALAGLKLGSCLTGCGRQKAPQERKLEYWNAQTGKTEDALTLQLPGRNWQLLDSTIQGFLLTSNHSILALDFKGRFQEYQGATNACWADAGLLVTGENATGELYRVSAREFPSGRVVWSQELSEASILGCDSQRIYVSHSKGISCYELAQGKKLWSNPALTDIKSVYLESKSLILGLGNQGKVCWVDLQTGQEQLSRRTTNTPNRVILLASDGRMTLTFTRRLALAGYLSGQSEPVWVQPLPESSHKTSLLGLADGVVVLELHDSSLALELATGELLWNDILCPHLSICGKVALLRRPSGLGAGQAGLGLEGHDLRTGRLLWKRQVSDLNTLTAVDGGRFVVLTS